MSYIGSKPANKPVVASDLDPAVITGQTALAVAPADTDEFLVSDAGTLKRVDYSYIKGGGAWELVSRAAIGGSAVASVTFTGLSTSGESYMLVWNGIDSVADSSEDLFLQVSTDNGSAYRTTGYKSATFQFYSDGGEDSYSASAGFSLSENQAASDVAEGNNGWLIIHNMASSLKTAVTGQSVTMGDSDRVRMNSFGGFYDTAEDTDAVRILFESGNITASTVGYISLYKQVIA